MTVESGQPMLDDAAFTKLEAAGGVALPPELRSRLSVAVSRCAKIFAFSESLSPATRKAFRDLATEGKKFVAAVEYFLQTPAALCTLLYEEGTAMAVLVDGIDAEVHRKAQGELQGFLTAGRALVSGAERRNREIDAMEPKRRPANTHIDMLCREVAQIFEDAGGRATIGGDRSGPFARFIGELHQHLPSQIRPNSSDAMVMQAQRAMPLYRKQRARLGPQRRDDVPRSKGLDEAIAAALKMHSRSTALGHKKR